MKNWIRIVAASFSLLVPMLFIAACAPQTYRVFQYDNGDDYFSEGLRRIVGPTGKMGYADERGKIVIRPQFQCAFPFLDGRAKVADDCTSITDGEHRLWISKNWYYIGKDGKRLDE